MRKVNIYKIGKTELIASFNVRNVYESSFYFRPMPTLSAKRCREVLNTLYPNFKSNSDYLVFEWDDTKFTWTQNIHRQGTILVG